MAAGALGTRYWYSRKDEAPGQEQFRTQGYGKPRAKYGCMYCRGPLVTEAGQWAVFTRDPRTLAFDLEVAGGRFPGKAAAERFVQARHDAGGYQPGFIERWVAAAADGNGGGITDADGNTVSTRGITRAMRLLFPHPVRLGSRGLGNGEFLLRLPSASACSLGSPQTGWRSLEDFLARHLGHGTQATTIVSTRVVPLRAGGHDFEFALQIRQGS